MSEPVIEEIKKEIAANKILVFMKGTPDAPRCGFSAATIDILKTFPYPFKGIDILSRPEIRETLPEYSHWPTFPQIFINGQLIGGCDIMHELRDSGELEKILADTFKK